jgi:hypothetical protein
MASIEEIRLLTIKAVTEGVDKATADLNKLSEAQAGLTIESDKSSKASTSVKNTLENQSKSVDSAFLAQNQFNVAQLAFTRGLMRK